VSHAITLMIDVGTTKEALGFEEQTLDALLDGFKSSGWAPPSPVAIDTSAGALAAAAKYVPAATATTTTSATVATASTTAKPAKKKAKKSRGKPTTASN
jgi:hypothetical protein